MGQYSYCIYLRFRVYKWKVSTRLPVSSMIACLSVASLAKSLRSRSQGLPAITEQTNGREWSEACPSLLIMCFIVVLYQLYFWGRSLIKYPTSDFPQFDFNCTALQSLKSSTVTDLCEKKWSKQCWWQGNDHNAANMMFCWVECRRMSEEDVLPPFQLISACCALSAPVECSILLEVGSVCYVSHMPATSIVNLLFGDISSNCSMHTAFQVYPG